MCLVSSPKDLMLSDMAKAFHKFDITHLSMTPSAASLISAKHLPKVKCLITAGEMTKRSIIKDWASTGFYFNAYGPTETTNVCTVGLVGSESCHPSWIGKLLSGSNGYILDKNLNVLPIFSSGELFIGGAQVIRGYLGEDELNSESFVEHPKFGRIYRTGDVR